MVNQQASEKSIFMAAIEINCPAERDAYLEHVCGGNEELRAAVDDLLESHQRCGSMLDEPVFVGTLANLDGQVSEGPGSVIGRYKLLQRIGEGGFGLVYMAEQQEPVVRKVALKIIKLGMDTRQVVARFEAERQALAMMDHPHISKVHDAGATETGRPYFVMELVRGIPITEYCDQNRLSTNDRLQLFIDVCHAVQHAHQKGIIHRDIKPTNVLVTMRDGRPLPESDRLWDRQGDSAKAHREDTLHGLSSIHRHTAVHEPRTGDNVRWRRGYSHRCLFAGRFVVRVVIRTHAIPGGATSRHRL